MEEDAGGDEGPQFLEDATNVDESQLTLPQFKWAEGAGGDLKTGEEDEEVVFKCRGKLYRSAGGEWKERGTGDVKLLKHTGTGAVRLVMRQERTLKLCANHYCDPSQELRAQPGSDRSWTWRTEGDCAEGDPKPEVRRGAGEGGVGGAASARGFGTLILPRSRKEVSGAQARWVEMSAV